MNVVFYDGACAVCNRSVRFILRHERDQQLKFCALQSEIGQALLKEQGVDGVELNTIYFLDDDGIHDRSTAVMKICRHLHRPLSWLAYFQCIPLSLRDRLYEIVAKHRYRISGRQDVCDLTMVKDTERFIDMS